MTSSAALEVDQLEVCYGGIQAVRGISFSVNPGEIVAMIGANGAGKSSTLRAIAGAVPHAGVIRIGNQVIRTTHPEEIVRKGLSLVPEGRGIFANLSIEENLRLGAWTNRSNYDMNLSKVFGLFPRLKERRNQMAGTLSGGEQQMLAMGRALSRAYWRLANLHCFSELFSSILVDFKGCSVPYYGSLRQCCGSGMIYSGSSFKFSEFLY